MTLGEVINEVISVIMNSPLRAAINGTVARRRPINSTKEDIIVTSLPLTFSQLQRCVVNVNIHVPNIEFTANGVVDTEYPNFPRLEELAALAIPIFKLHIGNGIYFTLQQSGTRWESKSSYTNFRLVVRAKNI